MRIPRRRRPRKGDIGVPQAVDLDDLAGRVRYVGSTEHKDFPSFAGIPRLRADASICPREIRDQAMVEDWLRSAIRRGAVSKRFNGGFPRYIWYRSGDTVFEARLVNQGDGSYKGYPLGRDEWPAGIEELYG